MKSNPNPANTHWARVARICAVVGLVLLSSYCTRPDNQKEIDALNADEAYLAQAYARVADARDIHAVTPLESESLFTVLDSTIDTLRIANTIRALETDPNRWVLIYRAIRENLEKLSQGRDSVQGQVSEEAR